MNITYEEFNWQKYIEINIDLQTINNKNEAWDHWINHGQYEERPLTVINNTFIHNGRLGNLFFINMAMHFIALKYNLKCDYKYFKKFDRLGIYLHKGNKVYNSNILLTDDNFIDIIKNNDNLKSNIIINNENWFQTKYFVKYLYTYFNMTYIKYKIINNNIFKKRYNNNNDLFIHVRLGDIENRVNNIKNYYESSISQIDYITGYISSDNLNHDICKYLINKYHLIVIEEDEIDTIMFASTCNNIILSGGTYSWLIGFLAFFSKYIYYPNIQNCWYGEIFQFTHWNSVKFN
jgi:hypothetical protein